MGYMVDLPTNISFQNESFSVISRACEEEMVHRFGHGVAALEAIWCVASLEVEQMFVERCVPHSELRVEAHLPFAEGACRFHECFRGEGGVDRGEVGEAG